MKNFTYGIGTTEDLQQILRPREVGEALISHVLREAVQPEPDFEAMKRLVSGHTTEKLVLEGKEA